MLLPHLNVSDLTCRSTLARVSSLHLNFTGTSMISLHLTRRSTAGIGSGLNSKHMSVGMYIITTPVRVEVRVRVSPVASQPRGL